MSLETISTIVAIITIVLAVLFVVVSTLLRRTNAKLLKLTKKLNEENEELIKEVEMLNQLISIRKLLIDQLQQDVNDATLSQARLAAQLLDLGASHQALWSKHLDTVDELLELQERYEPHTVPKLDTPVIEYPPLRLVE